MTPTSVFGANGHTGWTLGKRGTVADRRARLAMFFTNFQAMKAPKETTEAITDKFHQV
jgi:hypothetical protein